CAACTEGTHQPNEGQSACLPCEDISERRALSEWRQQALQATLRQVGCEGYTRATTVVLEATPPKVDDQGPLDNTAVFDVIKDPDNPDEPASLVIFGLRWWIWAIIGVSLASFAL
ncbi:hypothetical protein T484DRAFT_1887464, partial [Baffinella frigidus]